MEGKCGVFVNPYDAIMSSKGAYERYSMLTLKERGEVINRLRIELASHAEALASMEKEETAMGIYNDKLIQIFKAISASPGASFVEQNSVSDEEGLILYENFPFGVSCVIHPINHPVASLINHVIMLLSAGNSVINLIPKRAENVCTSLVNLINNCVADICGIDNLVICMADTSYEYNRQIMESPDVSLVVATGGTDITNKVLSLPKKVIAAGCANPVTIIDTTADIRNAAKDISEAVCFDNNLLCTSEKSAVVLEDVKDSFKKQLIEKGAFLLNETEIKKLESAVFGVDMQIKREIIGQDANTILMKAGIFNIPRENIRFIIFDADATSPFVINEIAAPILPIVEARNFEEALILAKFIEQGFEHTATIFSKNIDHLSAASRLLRTSIFVKNGSSLLGAGIKGNAPVSFTIANITGEGAVSPKNFVKKRKCILNGSFERI